MLKNVFLEIYITILELKIISKNREKIYENFLRTNLFCSAKKLFCSVNFFPPKFFLIRKIFLFQNTRKNFGGKKLTEQKSFFAEQKRLVRRIYARIKKVSRITLFGGTDKIFNLQKKSVSPYKN